MNLKKWAVSSLIVASTLGMLSGCTSLKNMVVGDIVKNEKGAQDKAHVKAFESRFNAVVKDIKKKDDYKKIPLKKNADTEWFIRESYKLWDKQITKEQYVSNGNAKFPGYTSTFEFLADEFSK